MLRKSASIISRSRAEETKKFLFLLCTRKYHTKDGESEALPRFQSCHSGTREMFTVLAMVLLFCMAGCSSVDKKPETPPIHSAPTSASKPVETSSSKAKTVAGWEVTDFAGHGEVRE